MLKFSSAVRVALAIASPLEWRPCWYNKVHFSWPCWYSKIHCDRNGHVDATKFSDRNGHVDATKFTVWQKLRRFDKVFPLLWSKRAVLSCLSRVISAFPGSRSDSQCFFAYLSKLKSNSELKQGFDKCAPNSTANYSVSHYYWSFLNLSSCIEKISYKTESKRYFTSFRVTKLFQTAQQQDQWYNELVLEKCPNSRKKNDHTSAKQWNRTFVQNIKMTSDLDPSKMSNLTKSFPHYSDPRDW